ncbi:unnamed protein product [Pseudo-nitzschia multistriata]|uniref:Uncharacterized protein n=1 Tax=Pseudo-nitzschia multistriata TaxID=183589 RepID=A0A448YXN5_9STRA|nr:unnamed protein product [Pseudo-nitzschia multistriata]
MQDVRAHDRFENVQFKVPLSSTDGYRDMISHYLRANHGNRFALCWVHLSGHDRASWFVRGQRQLSESTSWSAAKKAKIVCDLVQTTGNCIQHTGDLDDRIMSC